MRKLLTTTFVTLDGVMQAPGGPDEDASSGFDLGGWSVGYFDDTVGSWMGETMTPPFDLLLGRKTYEIFAAFLVDLNRGHGRPPERRDEARRVADARSGRLAELAAARGRRGRCRPCAQGE